MSIQSNKIYNRLFLHNTRHKAYNQYTVYCIGYNGAVIYNETDRQLTIDDW